MKTRIFGLPPIGDPHSKILILGSMPGETSLRLQQYYGHSMNQFWKILAEIFGVNPFRTYQDKKAFLIKHRIALWDVVKSCHRHRSSDLSIQKVEANDIRRFLRDHPGIRHVLLNGRAAEKYFTGIFKRTSPVPYDYVPSTSPAHAGLNFRKKARLWEAAFAKAGVL